MDKELSDKDKEVYVRIASYGSYEDMFDFGYALGQEDVLKNRKIN